MFVVGCGGDDDAADDGADRSTTTGAVDAAEPGTAPSDALLSGAEARDLPPADGPAVPSSGCAGDAPAPELTKDRRPVDVTDPAGEARWYLLTAPAQTDPVPLVVDFHGLTEGAELHTHMSALGETGLDAGFATAFPHGSGEPVGWRTFGDDLNPSELPFVDAVLDDVFATRCIDTSRVYATGLSNGAMLTSLLACTRTDRFAAFAPVAGLSVWDGCRPSRPAPILAFHGTADPVLFFNGGFGSISYLSDGEDEEVVVPEADLDGEGYPATARRWAELNGCDPEAVDVDLAEEVIDRTWTCPPGAAVEFVIVRGGGHSWPGSEFSTQVEAVVGHTTHDIDANAAMWEFFQRYQLPS